jgi:hypothetical protein
MILLLLLILYYLQTSVFSYVFSSLAVPDSVSIEQSTMPPSPGFAKVKKYAAIKSLF